MYTSSWVAPKADVHSQQRFFYMGQKGEINVDQAHRGYTVAKDGDGFRSVNPLFMKYTPSDGERGVACVRGGVASFCFSRSKVFLDAGLLKFLCRMHHVWFVDLDGCTSGVEKGVLATARGQLAGACSQKMCSFERFVCSVRFSSCVVFIFSYLVALAAIRLKWLSVPQAATAWR